MSASLPVDVVVVTWNSRTIALRCLEHLAAVPLAGVTLVDNASSDGTADAVREGHPEVELVVLEPGLGLAAAYNRGAGRGSAPMVLFLNDDIFADETAVRLLVRAVDEQNAVAAAGRLVDAEAGSTQGEYQPQPFPTVRSVVAMLAGRKLGGPRLSETETVVVDQPPGACLLVRRDALEAVGGWDPDFEFWYEDVDLARRLRAVGEIVYVPAAAFAHVGGHSARRLSRAQVVSRHYRGALLYVHKHFSPLARITVGLLYALVGATKLLSRDRDARSEYATVLRSGLRVATGRPPLPS